MAELLLQIILVLILVGSWLQFHRPLAPAQAACCAPVSHAFRSPYDWCGATRYYYLKGKHCCGVGKCNVFCCSCDGGCVRTDRGSSIGGWPGFLFKRLRD